MYQTTTRLIVMLALLVCSAAPVAATRYFVDGSAASAGTGLSWASPFQTVQAALGVSTSGDEIWVARGTYTGNFTVPAGVALYGGHRNGGLAIDRRPMQYRTILDAQGVGRVLMLGDQCTVDGFVVQNGVAASPGGGGALVQGTSPTIANCIFTANRNTGGRGAALTVNGGGNPTVYNCVFAANLGSGHAVDVLGAGGDYLNIVVDGNTSNGFHIQNGASPRVINSVFTNNSGRGICDVSSNNQPIVTNCLFDGNGISHFHYRGNELRTIAAVDALSYVSQSYGGAPGFVSPMTLDFTPTAGSPMIDNGIPTTAPAVDLKLRRRPYDDPRVAGPAGAHDAGAIEWQGCTLTRVGVPMIGSTITISIAAPGEGLERYHAASSFTDGTVAMPGMRQLRIGIDSLFVLSAFGATPVFSAYVGLLTPQGVGQLTIRIPALPALRGTVIYTGVIVQRNTSPFAIDAIADPLLFTIV